MPATYDKIATATAAGGATSISFTSIPSTYTDLVIVINGAYSAAVGVYVQFNGDNSPSGTNYSQTLLFGTGSAASSTRASNFNWAAIGYLGSENSTTICSIMNYANTTTFKTAIGRGNSASNLTLSSVALWRSTAAINRVDLLSTTSTYTAGTTATIYGIKAA